MRICIDIGHNLSRIDSGAIGYESEDMIVKAIGLALQKLLINRGHTVKMTQPIGAKSVSESLQQRVQQSNDFNAELFLSLHCNASAMTQSARGHECWAYSKGSKSYAFNIVRNFVSLGFKDRGVKTPGVDGGNIYVLQHTNSPAVLIEACFIDSKADCDLWNKLGADKLAVAIADAVAPVQKAQAATITPVAQSKALSGRALADVIDEDKNTSALAGLNKALIEQARSLGTGLSIMQDPDKLLDITDLAVNLALQPKVAASFWIVAKAYKQKFKRPLKINSCYRTAVQQICMFEWASQKKNGIELAAIPGTSNHEFGNAIDVEDWQNAAPIFKANGWMHQLDISGNDPFHFEINAQADRLSVLALQQYWNKYNPNKQLSEDGKYGNKTRSAALQLPIEGY